MDVTTLSPFRQEFLRRTELRKDDERRVVERDQKHRKDKEEREKKADREDRETGDMILIMATETELAEFSVTLDAYDAATVEALQINEERSSEVRKELDRMLEEAYVLPDGRRVFKTEDGLRVFDERGVEVENFDPSEIEETRPHWEKFARTVAEEKALAQERQQLFEYQAKLDEARERVDNDEKPLTHNELESLKASIENDKPNAVKRVLGEEVTTPTTVADHEAAFDPASLASLIRKPGMSPT